MADLPWERDDWPPPDRPGFRDPATETAIMGTDEQRARAIAERRPVAEVIAEDRSKPYPPWTKRAVP